MEHELPLNTLPSPIFLPVLKSLRYTLRVNERPSVKRFQVATNEKLASREAHCSISFSLSELALSVSLLSRSFALRPTRSSGHVLWIGFQRFRGASSSSQDTSAAAITDPCQQRKRKRDIGIIAGPTTQFSYNSRDIYIYIDIYIGSRWLDDADNTVLYCG